MTKHELTEYVKSAKDPVYFLNTYGYVYDITKKQIDRLTCFSYQEDMVKKFQKNQNNIVLKSRQLGLSVVTAGFVAWTLLFKIDQRILIVANDGAAAVRFLETVKQFLNYLPKFFYDPKKDDEINNQKYIGLRNGNWVKAVASGKQAGRGEALTMLILDEVAFIENADDIWMGAGLALTATKGKCIMISTPFGTGNLYHRTWVAAEKQEGSSFIPTTIHWTEHPVYSVGKELRKDEFGREYWWSPWYEHECERFNFDKIKIAQELDLSFEGSKALVIESHIIAKYRQDILVKGEPICYYDHTIGENCFVNNVRTNFWVWEKPLDGHNYIVSSDVGRGDGSDYSTIQVIDANELKQVAEYQGKIPPDLFAHLIHKIALEYNKAYVVIECNSFGLATCLVLKNQLRYDSSRIYHSKSIKKMVNHHWNVDVDENGEIPGFQTTTTTRPLIINSLTSYLRDRKIELNSKRLVTEFDTFIYNGVKPEHSSGYHDDLIIALAIALYIRDTQFQNVFISKDFYKSMLESFSHSTSENKYDVNKPKTPGVYDSGDKRVDDDLSWLLS